MIPMKLSVRNFMCYRDNVPPLDLDGIHVACLCGDNGHGKSALLDAMTWALWGRARTRTPELIHQGRSEMAVELEFKARDQMYRVSRKFSRSSRSSQGTTVLEFQVVSDNGSRPITGNTVGETQARIRDILHMDYNTFVNTAFLLQGRADMFTKSTPAQRKECLAEVLDLSYYQQLEEQARERSRTAVGRLTEVEGAIAIMQKELGEKSDSESRLATIEVTLARVGPEADTQRSWVESLREGVESLRGRQGELGSLDERLKASQGEMDEFARQIEEHQGRIRQHDSVQEREAEIRERSSHLDQVRGEASRLDEAALQAARLEREMSSLRESIADQQGRLSGQISHLEAAISTDIEPKAGRVYELEKGLQAASAEQAELKTAEAALAGLREAAQGLSAKVQYLGDSSATLLKEMEETRKKFDMLGEDEAVCPLCKQPLGDEGQEHLTLEYETQGKEAKLKYQQNTEEEERTKRERSELLAQTSRQETKLDRRRREIDAKIANGERDLAESHQARADLADSVKRVDDLKKLLESGEFASEERTRLAGLDTEMASLDYDSARHGQVREELKALDPYADLNRRLTEALDSLPRERESLVRVLQMRDRRQGELEAAERRREELARELEALPSLEPQLAEARARLKTLEDQRQNALVDRGVVTERLQRLEGLQQEQQVRERERETLLEEKGIYDELSVAFGRNGIQALIIETAIPQLQDDANELLGRLTDNRMSLKLQLREGRRERLTGLPSEELDIRIADEVGTRSYETFSGGEAFRINFALRIALSRLLAQRSGAPLPTLFIDEGFGSQDSAGQERLKEAIQSIQSDFQKIIVITHLEEIKDSFPTRIEVTKTGGGSTFVVV